MYILPFGSRIGLKFESGDKILFADKNFFFIPSFRFVCVWMIF